MTAEEPLKLELVNYVTLTLPGPHLHALMYLIQFFNKIAKDSDSSKMGHQYVWC